MMNASSTRHVEEADLEESVSAMVASFPTSKDPQLNPGTVMTSVYGIILTYCTVPRYTIL